MKIEKIAEVTGISKSVIGRIAKKSKLKVSPFPKNGKREPSHFPTLDF